MCHTLLKRFELIFMEVDTHKKGAQGNRAQDRESGEMLNLGLALATATVRLRKGPRTRVRWGLGIGRALTEACIECAKAAGFSQLELDVVAANTAALRLYESVGFVISHL